VFYKKTCFGMMWTCGHALGLKLVVDCIFFLERRLVEVPEVDEVLEHAMPEWKKELPRTCSCEGCANEVGV
jgi:hypothetical protein